MAYVIPRIICAVDVKGLQFNTILMSLSWQLFFILCLESNRPFTKIWNLLELWARWQSDRLSAYLNEFRKPLMQRKGTLFPNQNMKLCLHFNRWFVRLQQYWTTSLYSHNTLYSSWYSTWRRQNIWYTCMQSQIS